jgi:hypothetical protein
MTTHERLKKDALRAIDEVFSDTTVSAEETLETLTELLDEIEMKRGALIAENNL